MVFLQPRQSAHNTTIVRVGVGGFQSKGRFAELLSGNRHQMGLSATLHLLPGVVFLVVYWFAARFVCRPWHLPSFLASLIGATFGVLLCQLGFLFYLGRWRNGRFALTGVVLYRQRLNFWKLALVTLPLMVGLFL